jgi:hypothetical protein
MGTSNMGRGKRQGRLGAFTQDDTGWGLSGWEGWHCELEVMKNEST